MIQFSRQIYSSNVWSYRYWSMSGSMYEHIQDSAEQSYLSYLAYINNYTALTRILTAYTADTYTAQLPYIFNRHIRHVRLIFTHVVDKGWQKRIWKIQIPGIIRIYTYVRYITYVIRYEDIWVFWVRGVIRSLSTSTSQLSERFSKKRKTVPDF